MQKISMIFPNEEDVEEDSLSISSTNKIQKQALQMIIYLYLTRKTDEDLSFLNSNFGKSDDLACNLDSDLLWGLNEKSLSSNRLLYGQNSKKKPFSYFSLRQIMFEELKSWNFVVCLVVFLCNFIYSLILENKLMIRDAATFFICYVITIVLRIILSYYYQQSLSVFALERDKNNWYRVVRNKKLIQVQQHDLIVGDIVLIGFKEKVPASGILISNDQVTINENNVNRKYQKKLPLEKCIKAVQQMSNLQQKLCFENQTLPSPIIIRGSQILQGQTFRMMILTVTQDKLIQQNKSQQDGGFKCVNYEKWKRNFIKKWSTTTKSMFFVSSVLIILGKIIQYQLLKPKTTIKSENILQIVILIGFTALLLDLNNLCAFLRIRMIKLITSLQVPEKITQFLTADKILISEQNIIKYDKMEITKFCFSESDDILDLNTLNNINQMTIGITEQVLNNMDVELCVDSFHKNEQREHINTIIHNYEPNIKIVSCLSEQKLKNPQSSSNPFKYNPRSSLKSPRNRYLNEQKQQQLEKLKRKRQSAFLDPVIKNLHENTNQLDVLLPQNFQFRRSILEGITEIAEKQCRTYYLIKYHDQQLAKINKIVQKGQILPFTEEKKEKFKTLAKKLTIIYEQQPFILGFSDGFYSLKPMGVLACIVGIPPFEQNFILKELIEIQHIGIKPLILVGNSNDNFFNEDKILQEYNKRGLVSMQPHKIFNIQVVRQRSGRLVCGECLIRNCNCINKKQQLSDIQGFLALNEYVKIIYNVNFESDIRYLECAYTQICHTFLNFYSTKCKTQNMLFSIVEGIKFSEVLKRLVRYWIGSLLQNFACCMILWIVFNEVLYVSQMSIILLLCFIGGFIGTLGNLNISIETLGKIKRNQIKVVQKKSGIHILIQTIFCVSLSALMIKFSYILPQYEDEYDQIIKEKGLSMLCKYCQPSKIAYLFDPSQCSFDNQIIYSRLSTMVATYLFFTNWFTLVLEHRNFFSGFSVIVYIIVSGVYLILLYETPSLINSYYLGLSLIQLLICLVLGLFTFIISILISNLLDICSFSEYFLEELQSEIIFNEDKLNHYSVALKNYLKQMNKNKKHL